MKLIKLHLGLFKYLKEEIKRKRTSKQWVIFSKNLILLYIKELIKLYKSMFDILDPQYRKQKDEYNKYNKLKVDLHRALKLLEYVDTQMEKSGVNRQRRRQFWRDFYSSGQCRKDVFERLMKEIEGYGRA